MSDFVTLTVNGEQFGGFKSVRIEAGIERVARSFEVSVTDKWPGSAEEIRRIKPGDNVEVRIGDDLICTCYVDAVPVDYDAQGITVMVRGRSKTADLVDCSADNSTGQFKGLKAEAIASKLAGQYGVNVVAQAATGAALTDHQIQQGESAFESLDRLAKQRQVMMSDNGSGDLVILSPGSGGHARSTLELGVNILSASAGFDYSEVYSDYTVKGQNSRQGQDSDWDATSAGLQSSHSGTAKDSSLKRRRVLVVRQSGQADSATCQQRASTEQRVRAAKAGEIRYKIAGWRQEDGSLWQPNQTVDILDGIMGVDGSRLISEIIYTLDEGGMVTELVCISPDAFLSEAETKAQANARTKTTGTPGSSW